MAFFTVPSYNVHPKGPRSQPGKGLGKNQRKNGYTLVKYRGFYWDLMMDNNLKYGFTYLMMDIFYIMGAHGISIMNKLWEI